jgi:apolipoprotein N-acyltransferase
MLLGWIGLIPWLLTLERARSWTQALVSGWLMSVAFVGAVFWWFAAGIADYTGIRVLWAALVLALLAPLLQPQLITVAAVFYGMRDRGFRLRVLAVASAYCGTEWILPKLFGDTIGHGFFASQLLRQAADVAGAAGLTFVLVVANQAILGAARSSRRAEWRNAGMRAGGVAAIVVALAGYGQWRLAQLSNRETDDLVKVVVVQGALSHYSQWASEVGTYEAVRHILDTYFALSAPALAAGDIDLLVWPETVYPTTFGQPKSEAGAAFDREIAAFVGSSGVPLIFGAYDVEEGIEYNAAIFLEAEGANVTFDTYRKGELFPLTERVPWPLDTGMVRGWMPWLGTWTPGGGAEVITVDLASGRSLQLAPLICYDAVAPERALAAARRGADLIVTLSNDSWFALGGGPRLHLVVSAFRTLETRLPQVRATNTGISALIMPSGDLVAAAGVGERAARSAEVSLAGRASTLMLLWGDWFGRVSCLLLLLCLALGVRRRSPESSTAAEAKEFC